MKVALSFFMCVVIMACAGKRTPVVTQPQQPTVTVVPTAAPVLEAPGPTTHDVWQFTLLSVAPLAQRGDFVAADSMLATFARAHDGSCEAAESKYVRALLRLSPHHGSPKVETALPLLDSYLSSNCVAPGRAAEALLIRRVATDLMRQDFAGDSASSEEIRKLKEQLDASKKELDRLKMRVIPPPP